MPKKKVGKDKWHELLAKGELIKSLDIYNGIVDIKLDNTMIQNFIRP